jgi:methylated-DNA-[protein]-cysteine S-methyltransferase
MTTTRTTTPLQTSEEHLLRMDSPLGRIQLTSDGTSITSLTIERDGALPRDGDPEKPDRVLKTAARQLDGYFAGTRKQFTLPISLAGTDFQRSVWAKLRELDWGEVTSYGAIGVATGRGPAGRAVGGAIRANPLPIIVPCHRVLAAGGKITGYSQGSGIPTKEWLLDHEGIVHRARVLQVS